MMRDIKTREGFEFWDKLNALPRYAFLLSPSGKSVQKFEDQAMGNWIDVHEAQKIVDQAQDRISELRDELGAVKGEYDRAVNKVVALQQRLNAADQLNDDRAGTCEWSREEDSGIELGEGSYLFRDRTTNVRFSLRDLGDGPVRRNEKIPSCSFFCEMAEADIANNA